MNNNKRWIIWSVSIAFVLFQFFTQLAAGVIVQSYMHTFGLTLFTASLVLASYYIVYVALQTPAGMMIDRFGPRRTLTAGGCVCIIGSSLFVFAPNVYLSALGRILVGAGAAYAFVSYVYLVRAWFPPRRFAFMVSLVETAALVITIINLTVLAKLTTHIDWHRSMALAIPIAIIVTFCSWRFIKDGPDDQPKVKINSNLKKDLKLLISSKLILANGIICGMLQSAFIAFAIMWAIPYYMKVYDLSLTISTLACMMVLLGTAVGSPFFGWLSDRLQTHRKIFLFGTTTSVLLSILVIYVKMPIALLLISLFSLGFCSSMYMLNYVICDKICPAPFARNTAMGLTNTLGFCIAATLQPLIGLVLHTMTLDNASSTANIHDYKIALILIPITLIGALMISVKLPETHQ